MNVLDKWKLDELRQNIERLRAIADEEIARRRAAEAKLTTAKVAIDSLCKAYCAGREAYSAKNRHEPNCARYELGEELWGAS